MRIEGVAGCTASTRGKYSQTTEYSLTILVILVHSINADFLWIVLFV